MWFSSPASPRFLLPGRATTRRVPPTIFWAERRRSGLGGCRTHTRTGRPQQSTQEEDFEPRKLAAETGARAFFPVALHELAGVDGGIADELAHQYALGYESSNANCDGAFRRIALRITVPARSGVRDPGILPSANRSQDTDGALRRSLAFTILGISAFVWLAALLWAPTPAAGIANGWRSSAAYASALVYVAGSFVCHQRPERSFHRAGAQLPVCARCFGLYAGGLLGIFVWAGFAGIGNTIAPRAIRTLQSRKLRLALILTTLPTMISLAVVWLGWWDVPNTPRAVSAVPLGSAIGALVAAFAAGDLR